MTSSLVGSEMCIRDSSWDLPPDPWPEPAPRRERWQSPRAGAWEDEALPSCLLYTSDAADDM
eukprot:11784125-Prorocentrum_lima.AAC.1